MNQHNGYNIYTPIIVDSTFTWSNKTKACWTNKSNEYHQDQQNIILELRETISFLESNMELKHEGLIQ